MTRIGRILGAASLAAAAAGFTAGTAPANSEAESRVTLVAKNFAFEPSKLTVEAGETLRIKFKNKGSLSHNLTFEELDAGTESIQTGNTRILKIQVDEPGTYEFVCTVPGHAQAGMKGKLVVK